METISNLTKFEIRDDTGTLYRTQLLNIRTQFNIIKCINYLTELFEKNKEFYKILAFVGIFTGAVLMIYLIKSGIIH